MPSRVVVSLLLFFTVATLTAHAWTTSPRLCSSCLFMDFTDAVESSALNQLNASFGVNATFIDPDSGAAVNTFCFDDTNLAAGIAAMQAFRSVPLPAGVVGAIWCKPYASPSLTATLPLPTTPAPTTTMQPTSTPVTLPPTTTATSTDTPTPTATTTTTAPTTVAPTTMAPSGSTTVSPQNSSAPSTMAPTTMTTAPATTAAGGNTTTSAFTTTIAPTIAPTAAPTAPAPLQFTVTFANASSAQSFLTLLARALNIQLTDIQVVSNTSTTIVFQFVGSNAGILSQAFNAMSDAQIKAQFGITARQSAPADTNNGGGDDNMLVIWIAVSVLAVIVIVVVAVIVRSRLNPSADNGRVNFHDYMQMANTQAKQSDTVTPAKQPPPVLGQEAAHPYNREMDALGHGPARDPFNNSMAQPMLERQSLSGL